MMKRWCLALFAAALLGILAPLAGGAKPQSFHFEILGDRTGEAQPGVYEEAWREAAADHPAFVLTVGDIIQGGDDASARAEWTAVQRILKPYRAIPLYLTPGNHDIWSPASEALFREFARHAPHYSFDYRQAHFTVLDNSRDDQLSDAEMAFLRKDLVAHAAQPVKFVLSHRPSWILDAMMRNPGFPVQHLAKKYGVGFVIAGHVHQMVHASVDGVEYMSVPSAGGHLRASKKYEDGWFFAHTDVEVSGSAVHFTIHELRPPYGEGRRSELSEWGTAGLANKRR